MHTVLFEHLLDFRIEIILYLLNIVLRITPKSRAKVNAQGT